MTIGIAAIAQNGDRIVAVSDRMISSAGVIPAADDGTLKARKISKTWAVMFAAEDANFFLPIVKRACELLGKFDGVYDLPKAQAAVCGAYRTLFDAEFNSRFLVRYSIRSIAEFRQFGFAQFGQEKFRMICDEIEKFDLGISLLGYGFDTNQAGHLFEVNNPGVGSNHDLLGYAVIGSGFWMATASIRTKPLPHDLNELVYRILEAKFSAETAPGVGRSTTLFTMNAEGKDDSLPRGSIERIKEIWTETLKARVPDDALKIISDKLGPHV